MQKRTREEYEEIDNKLVKALFSFQYQGIPFWTLLCMRMHRRPVEGLQTIETQVTDKKIMLLYDPDIVKKSEQSQLRFHLVHECLHLIYRHMFRFAYSEDVVDLATLRKDKPETNNPVMPIKSADLAADLAANRDLFILFKDFEQYGVTSKDVPHFCMSNLETASSEDIEKYISATYTKVVSPGKGGSKEQPDKSQEPTKEQGEGGGSGEQDQDLEQNQEGGGSGTDVNGKHVNNHKPGVSKQDTEISRRIKQRMVEDMVSRAADIANVGQGSLPNTLKQELELIKRPPRKDWKNLLREHIKCSLPAFSTRTWARINRRHPYLVKGKKPRRIPLIGVAMDTSGSVSDKELIAFLEEIDHIRKVYGSDLDIVQCDCKISDVWHIKAKSAMPKFVTGRGGTEFVPALEWFDKAKRKPDVVVFFTDLCVSDNDVPTESRSYNILWVGTNVAQCEHFSSLGKYGTFIAMEIEEDERGF